MVPIPDTSDNGSVWTSPPLLPHSFHPSFLPAIFISSSLPSFYLTMKYRAFTGVYKISVDNLALFKKWYTRQCHQIKNWNMTTSPSEAHSYTHPITTPSILLPQPLPHTQVITIFKKIFFYIGADVLGSGVQQSDSVRHTHLYSFSDSFPIWVITEYWVEFLVLYSQSLLVIYFMNVCVSCSVMPDSLQHYGLCSPPGSSVHGILQARIMEWLPFPSPILHIMVPIC